MHPMYNIIQLPAIEMLRFIAWTSLQAVYKLRAVLTLLTQSEPLWIHDHCLAACPTFCSSQALDVPCDYVLSMQSPKEKITLVEHTVLVFQNTRDPCSSTDAQWLINPVSEHVGSDNNIYKYILLFGVSFFF